MLLLFCLALGGVCWKQPEEPILEPVDVSRSEGRAEHPSIAVGPDGTAYVTWSEWNSYTDEQGRSISTEDIRLAVKPPGGTWSEPSRLTTGDPPARFPSIAVDRNGVVHLAWQQVVRSGVFVYWAICYMRRAPGDTWTTPDTITMYYGSVGPTLAVDQDAGRVHLYWEEAAAGYTCYACKPEGGVWQDFQSFPIDDTMFPFYCEMQTDNSGNVHFVQELEGKIYHRERKRDGQWSPLTRLSKTWGYAPSFAIADDGRIRVVWTDEDTCYRGFAFRERTSDGTWLPVVAPYRRVWKQSFWGTSNATHLGCVGDRQGRLHVIWAGANTIGYGVLADGAWSQPRVLAKGVVVCGVHDIAATPDGVILYTWGSAKIMCVEFKP